MIIVHLSDILMLETNQKNEQVNVVYIRIYTLAFEQADRNQAGGLNINVSGMI